MSQRRTVIVVGGGLAGLAATAALATAGWTVTLLESRPRLGGRAGSFTDGTTGQLVDACQHVSMGCCTEFEHFCRAVGIQHLLHAEPTLYFMTPDRRVSRWQASYLPAPLHYMGSFLRAHFLTWIEKIQISTALMRLWLLPPEDDEPFLDWLRRHEQSDRCIERFWAVVLVSALNESIDRMGIKYARQVFVEGFLRSRLGGQVFLPSVPLGELYGETLQQWMQQHGVTIQLSAAVKEVVVHDSRVQAVQLRDGSTLQADHYVLAVPSHRLASLLPAQPRLHAVEQVEQLTVSPITSVHFWHDRPITTMPHAVLLGSTAQWLFNRGEVVPGQFYTQLVISAAHSLLGLGNDAILAAILKEVQQFFPAARDATLLHSRVVTEKAATFSAVPGVDQFRPGQATEIRNLVLAGDYTRTDWPATMEGAVRSGYRAAKTIQQASMPAV